MEENEWYERAWERMEAEDFAQAQAFFEQAIKDGVAEAYCDLGNLYFMGNGVGQDYGRAFELFKKGAKAGNPDCMRNLGICYFWGFGPLGDCYRKGFGVEKDERKAFGLYKKGAEMGLLLLIISNKNSAQGLMPRFFCYGRERLAHLARTCQFAGNVGEGQWIDEFIYDMECDEKSREWHYAYNSKMYSNEARKASEGFREVCSDDEMELFKIRMTGGQNSMTSIGVGPMQIVVPDSLAIFTKDLPSREDMLVYRPVMRRPEDFASAKRLNSAKYEDWEREIRD